MRRGQAILLIVALLATPLALLARGIACDNACCGAMCCMPHGSPSAPPSSHEPGKGMTCDHDMAGHMQCGTTTRHKALDFGFIAPMAPTFAESLAHVVAPLVVRQPVARYMQFPVVASLPVPLKPPRA